jgi:hypothetical protein
MMTKNSFIVLIIILLGFLNSLSAQPQIKDSTEAYSYWAQRGIIEMVYAYMNDYFKAVTDTTSSEKKKGNRINERKGAKEYKSKYISQLDKNELPSFQTISTFLKNNSWEKAEKNLFQPLVKNYKDSLQLNEQFFFSSKRNISKDKKIQKLVLIDYIPGNNGDRNNRFNWKNKGKEIVTKYNKKLATLSEKKSQKKEVKEEKTSTDDDKIDAPIKPKMKPSEHSKWGNWIIYLAVFIFGIIIGGWLVYILLKRRITKILDSVDEKKNKLESGKRRLNNNLKSLEEENKRLKREISEFKQKESQLDNITQKPDIEPKNTLEWNIKQPNTVKRKLFFSMPESDGRFIVDNGESSNDGRKYFRIDYAEGTEIGELYYISGERDKRAINRLESYLKPVCDIENIENADSATNIEFIKSGKVVLINDSWLIDSDNKAKIKLL